MLKKLFLFFAVTVVVLVALYWIYFPSISRYRELKLEEEKLTKRIEEIDAQIKTLSDERNLLQTDVAYLEKVIREELGFVKPGEIVYELITKKNSPPKGSTAEKPSNLVASGKTALDSKGKVAESSSTPVEKTKSATAVSTGRVVRKSIQ